VTTLVSFTTASGESVVFEAEEGSDGTVRRGLHPADLAAGAAESFDTLAERVRLPIQAVLGAFHDAAEGIDEVEVGFALTVRADAGVVVSRVGGDATFHVTVRWKRPPGHLPAPGPLQALSSPPA